MAFLILYRNQYKNLKKDKRKKTRIFQIFFLLVLGIWGAHATGAEDAYGEAFYNRIKGLSDNAEQFDSSHYYYQRLVPPVESNIVHPTSSADLSITCFIRNESGATINLASSLEHPSTYRNGEYCVTITIDRGSISKVTSNTGEVDLSGFRRDSKRNIMQACFANLDDLREKVRAGNIYGYSQETWFDESTGISLTVQDNIRKNIKIRSMALCFSEEERTTDIYFDVCSKENESEFFDPIKKSIITSHDELPAPSNFPKDIYFIKSGDKISKLQKEGKLREVFKNQSGSNVRSLWIKNSSFQKRVKNDRNDGIVYISADLPSQYRYGETDIDFKGLLIKGNVVEGQYFVLDGATTSSYSERYLYKKAGNQLFCVKLNKGEIKYTDSTGLEWPSSAENTVEYLTKHRHLSGASQTGSHNIEGFYQISGRPSGQMQNWLIFKDETNQSALFSTEFPRISVSDLSPDILKNDQKKDEEITFINFLSDWDLVQSITLEINNFSNHFTIYTSEEETMKYYSNDFARLNARMFNDVVEKDIYAKRSGYFYGDTVKKAIEKTETKRYINFLKQIEKIKIHDLSLFAISPDIRWLLLVNSGNSRPVSYAYLYSESTNLLNEFFSTLKLFTNLETINFKKFFHPLTEEGFFGEKKHTEPIIDNLKELLKDLSKLKVLKIEYSTYEMMRDNSDLVKYLKKLKLCIHHTPENQKEAIKSTLSGGQGEVFFENDLPPPSGCVIS